MSAMSSPESNGDSAMETGRGENATMRESESPPTSSPPQKTTPVPNSEMPPPPPRHMNPQGDRDSTNNVRDPASHLGEAEIDVLVDPQDEIADFDWRHLQEEYHSKILDINHEEQAIMAEFDSLCNYFSTWAQAGTTKEVDRTFKRFKTQMALVQHHEIELEERRQHYIKVVEAFKNALQLLAT